jgi:hypothetical protein
MKRYIVYAPHKCGSTILLKSLCKLFNKRMLAEQEYIINLNSQSFKFLFTRYINFRRNALNINHDLDHFIFIPRQPVSLTISMFYSWAYTHNLKRNLTEEKRRFYQKMGLNNFIIEVINGQSNKIKQMFTFNTDHKTIIPYELMISDFPRFAFNFLSFINSLGLKDDWAKACAGFFDPIEDQSGLIESGEIKAHKRTTDINEWKNKLSIQFREELACNNNFILEYDDFLKKEYGL